MGNLGQRIDHQRGHIVHIIAQCLKECRCHSHPSEKVDISVFGMGESFPIRCVFCDLNEIGYRERMPEKSCRAFEAIQQFIYLFGIRSVNITTENTAVCLGIDTAVFLRKLIIHEFHTVYITLGIDLIYLDFHDITIPSSSPSPMSSSLSLAQSGRHSSRMAPTTSARVI